VEILLPIVVGALVAAGLYLILRRSMMKIAIGLSLISHAANLLIFTSGGLTRHGISIIPSDAETLDTLYTDPLSQALILKVIVINFGVLAFTIALIYRSYQVIKTDDLAEFTTTEKPT
jgi:multicomponent Na+:H+ antiporter subunit C